MDRGRGVGDGDGAVAAGDIERAPTRPLYIESLDGIRAVAVTTVFFGHAWSAPHFPAGVAVTVFFFLSGYLITTLFRLEHEATGTTHIGHFYLRRVYRIFPPLYLVLALAVVLGLLGLVPHDMTPMAVGAQVLHLSNYQWIFSGRGQLAPFSYVLWSLAVEEHYYLLFPGAFWLLRRRMSYRQMALVFGGFCLLVLLWRWHLFTNLGHPFKPRIELGTDTRLDSIIFGCILGVWANPVLDPPLFKTRAAELATLLVAAAVMLFCSLHQEDAFRGTVRYSLQGLALFPLFHIAIKRHDWPLFRWLGWGPVKTLGLVSYTFYLCHPLCLHFATYLAPAATLGCALIGFVFSFAFSWLMYRIVESPLALHRKRLRA